MKSLAPLFLALAATAAWAQPAAPVTVTGSWARPSVQGQTSSGVYLTLTARQPLQLVGVSTPVAAAAEVHEMKLDGDVMRMRALPALDLPAGQPVQLKPSGNHVMLQQLKMQLKPGTSIPLTLTFRAPGGEQRQLTVQVPVSMTPPREVGATAAHGGHAH